MLFKSWRQRDTHHTAGELLQGGAAALLHLGLEGRRQVQHVQDQKNMNVLQNGL